MIYNSINDTIGDTPLIKLKEETHGLKNTTVYAKMEMMNPFGSVKDRIAKNIYGDKKKDIDSSKKVIESSSGNTAKALASLTQKKHEFKTITNRIRIEYIKKILQVIDTEIVELPGTNECPDPTNPQNPVAVIEQELTQHPQKYFHTNQYFNKENPQAHRETGKEIIQDLPNITDFFADIGTSGTTQGIGSYLREHTEQPPKIHGIITEAGSYVPGGRDMNELFETGFFEKDFYDDIHTGTTEDAIKGMLTLIRKEGILCGPTTGLVFTALQKALEKTKEPKTVVFIACDRMEPYIEYLENNKPSIFDKTAVKQENLPPPKQITEEEIPKEAIIVDTRVPYAYRRNGYPGSINIPLQKLDELLQQTTFLNDKPVVLLCAKGQKTKKTVSKLRHKGVEAYNLRNGIKGLQETKTD